MREDKFFTVDLLKVSPVSGHSLMGMSNDLLTIPLMFGGDPKRPIRHTIKVWHDTSSFFEEVSDYFSDRFSMIPDSSGAERVAKRSLHNERGEPVYVEQDGYAMVDFSIYLTLDRPTTGSFVMGRDSAALFVEMLDFFDRIIPQNRLWILSHYFNDKMRYKGPADIQIPLNLIPMPSTYDLSGLWSTSSEIISSIPHTDFPALPESLQRLNRGEFLNHNFEGFLNPQTKVEGTLHLGACPFHLLPCPETMLKAKVLFHVTDKDTLVSTIEQMPYIKFYEVVHPISTMELNGLLNFMDHPWPCVKAFALARMQGTLKFFEEPY